MFNLFFGCTLCRHLSIIGDQRRYSSRLLIPMFIGTPCSKVNDAFSKCIAKRDCLNGPPFNEERARLTTIPFKPLSEKLC